MNLKEDKLNIPSMKKIPGFSLNSLRLPLPSFHISLTLSLYLSPSLSIYLSLCLSPYFSFLLSFSLPVYLSLSISSSFSPSLCVSLPLSLPLSTIGVSHTSSPMNPTTYFQVSLLSNLNHYPIHFQSHHFMYKVEAEMPVERTTYVNTKPEQKYWV